jgi:small subunit ribosomal protein S18
MMKEAASAKDKMGGGGGGGGDKDGGFRRTMRRRGCTFCADDAPPIDYKDPQSLRYFVSERGKIVPRRISGCCAKHQRAVQLAVKHSRSIALLPFTTND